MLWAWILGGGVELDSENSEKTIKLTIWHFKSQSPHLAYSYNLTNFLMIVPFLLIMLNLNSNDSNIYLQKCWK
jgi:hypothetical protein